MNALLEEAAALVAREGPARLAGWLPSAADRLGDLSGATQETRRTGRSVALATRPGGPALGLRWFAPGMPTDVHGHHGWGALLVLEGTDRYERWEPAGPGRARLAEVRRLVEGDAHWFGGPPDDLHRQEGVGGGALELVLLAADPRPLPRLAYQPAEEAAVTDDSLLEKITAALETYDWPALTSLYRSDAVYDASVPQWRFQLRGPAAVREHAREELGEITDLRVAASSVTRTADGLVVELELRCRDELWREVNIVRTDGERITEHRVYCTGVWDAATIARQAVEAPMVRG